MNYLLQSITYSAILFGIYLLLLRNRATHSWNRKYLLASTILPVFLPLLQIPNISYSVPYTPPSFNVTLPEIIVDGTDNTTAMIMNTGTYAFVYGVVSAILLVILGVKLTKTMNTVRNLNYTHIPDDAWLAVNTGMGPGSFGKYIFLPGEEIDKAILRHELAHVQFRHSYDLIIMNLLQCIFWPNLLLPFIKKELQIVHEFEADAYAATDKAPYIQTLLGDIFGISSISIGHTFFHHPIKRRITMLQQNQSRSKLRNISISSGITALLLTTGLVYLQSCHPKLNEKQNTVPNEQKTAPASTAQTDENIENGVYKTADQMPVADYDINEFLGKNIKYPKNARKNNKEGRVIVKFIIDENGNIQSPQIMRSPDDELSEEALRVVKMMPAWQPGKNKGKNVPVYFFLPIQFSLE